MNTHTYVYVYVYVYIYIYIYIYIYSGSGGRWTERWRGCVERGPRAVGGKQTSVRRGKTYHGGNLFIGNLVIISSGNGLSPARRHTTTCTNAGLSSLLVTVGEHIYWIFGRNFHQNAFEIVVWEIIDCRPFYFNRLISGAFPSDIITVGCC